MHNGGICGTEPPAKTLVVSRSAEVLAELEKQAKAMSSASEEMAAGRLGTQPVKGRQTV